MPAQSKSQQRLFGMVHAYQKGVLKRPPAKIKEVARRISGEDAEDFASTPHMEIPERVKSAFVSAFVETCVDSGVPGEHVPLVVKRACSDPAVAAHFSDFAIKSSADAAGQGSSGSRSAPPSPSAPPTTSSSVRVPGMGESPGVRRFMGGMINLVNGVGKKKPAVHPLDVKNTLAIAEVAGRRRASLQQEQQAAQPQPPAGQVPAMPAPAQPQLPGMLPKIAGLNTLFAPERMKRPVNVNAPVLPPKPPVGISPVRRNPVTTPHTGPRAPMAVPPAGRL